MISKVKWVSYGMDFSEKPSGEDLSAKWRFVGQSCEYCSRCEEGTEKERVLRADATTGSP